MNNKNKLKRFCQTSSQVYICRRQVTGRNSWLNLHRLNNTGYKAGWISTDWIILDTKTAFFVCEARQTKLNCKAILREPPFTPLSFLEKWRFWKSSLAGKRLKRKQRFLEIALQIYKKIILHCLTESQKCYLAIFYTGYYSGNLM